MKNTASPLNTLRVAFLHADDAWGDELRRLFGNGAGDVRYNVHGKGAEGSKLRTLHDAREAARVAYDVAFGLGFRVNVVSQ